jgi:ATP-binding protein involved in chromosome partitioning
MVDEAAVRSALDRVEHPELHRSITDLGMVRGVFVHDTHAQLSIALLAQAYPLREMLRDRIVAAVRALGLERVAVDFTTLTEPDRDAVRRRLQAEVPPDEAFTSTRVFAVASGKGGVGKSSLSVNLAVAMARRGQRVALLDADVYGFSVPRMLGIDRAPLIISGLLVPPEVEGVSVLSVGFFVGEGTPVIWRGPMLHKMLRQFVDDVWWGSPDVLLVDMPPGTGDVSLTLAQLLPTAEVVVVTTPQPAAQRVAQRAAHMARQVKLHVAGVIENMSWFTGDDGARYEIFGTGGGRLLADELGVPLLGQVPLVPALREGGDLGRPVVVGDPAGEASQALEAVAGRLLEQRPAKVRRPELRIVAT